jgi:hypothetical protein
MAKRKEKEHVIEYEIDIDDHKAAVRAAREQYEETLYLVNGEPLSVLRRCYHQKLPPSKRSVAWSGWGNYALAL